LEEVLSKESKERSKEEKKEEQKVHHIFLHEILFLIKLLFYFLITPFLFLFYLFKGNSKEAFKPLENLLKSEIKIQKEPLVLLVLNLVVFLLYYFFSLLDKLFNTSYFLNLWNLIFVSSSNNYYLFNLSFMAHYELYHLLVNILTLYYTSYILSFKGFKVVRLFFIFGFLINLILFILSFFIKIPPNLGASGVVFAFLIMAIMEYPFAFSFLFLILYYLFYHNYFEAFRHSFNIFNLFNILMQSYEVSNLKLSEKQTFILSHFLGVILGLSYLLIFRFKEYDFIRKTILILLLIINGFILLKLLFFILK
jgi:hypothetical protein